MSFFFKKITLVVTSLITLSIGNLTAHAQQIWSGRGEIIEGDNQGASVQLKIKTDNRGNATILTQPIPNQTIPLQKRTETSIGIWEIYLLKLWIT